MKCFIHGHVWCSCPGPGQLQKEMEEAYWAGKKLAEEIKARFPDKKRERASESVEEDCG